MNPRIGLILGPHHPVEEGPQSEFPILYTYLSHPPCLDIIRNENDDSHLDFKKPCVIIVKVLLLWQGKQQFWGLALDCLYILFPWAI
jgi:hypothetical protein